MRELEAATGVNRESIRVFVRMGLIPAPARLRARDADYDGRHVRAIASVRSLQQQQGLSLAQIKKAMDGDVSSFPQRASGFQHLDALVAARLGLDTALIPVASVIANNPRAFDDASAMQRVGAVDLHDIDGVPHVSHADAQLIALWGKMRAAGFEESIGFAPEQLALYVDLATQLAEWEITTFVALTEGVVEEGAAARMVQSALADMLSCFALIRTKVALKALARTTSDGAAT